jgi:cysteine synthase A
VARYIKPKNPNFKAIAVEPVDSAVISGGKPGPHKIQGLGDGFIPKNLDTSLVDETILISNEESFQWSRRLAKEEGIVAGISSGANVCAAAKIAARPEYKGKRICVIQPSLGERYLSTPLFEGLTG